jgi:hypothetical protein
MPTKDPIVVKFGKDVAAIIHLWVWKLCIKSVNVDYHSHVEPHLAFITSDGVMLNWRCFVPQQPYTFVYQFRTLSQVAKLPKNYFQIKELY